MRFHLSTLMIVTLTAAGLLYLNIPANRLGGFPILVRPVTPGSITLNASFCLLLLILIAAVCERFSRRNK